MEGALKYGSYHLVADPEKHVAAYGARLIWDEVISGGTGVVWDRQDNFGAKDDIESLLPLVKAWVQRVRDLNTSGLMNGGSKEPFQLRDGLRCAIGGPQGSYGYLYVTVVLEKP